MSELLALGISHKTAPVALRERLAFTEQEASEFALQATATRRGARGGRDLDCNRTEVYLVVGDPVASRGRRARPARAPRRNPPDGARAGDLLAAQLRRRAPALPRDGGPGVDDRRRGGDPGPGRRAHEAAMRAGSRARSPTAYSPPRSAPASACAPRPGSAPSRVSVPSVAVDLALSLLGGFADRHVVILGAGETSELTARAFAEQGAGTIFVANRHADRALSLAQRFGGSVVGLDGLPISCCTPTSSSPRPPLPIRSSAARSSSW